MIPILNQIESDQQELKKQLSLQKTIKKEKKNLALLQENMKTLSTPKNRNSIMTSSDHKSNTMKMGRASLTNQKSNIKVLMNSGEQLDIVTNSAGMSPDPHGVKDANQNVAGNSIEKPDKDPATMQPNSSIQLINSKPSKGKIKSLTVKKTSVGSGGKKVKLRSIKQIENKINKIMLLGSTERSLEPIAVLTP